MEIKNITFKNFLGYGDYDTSFDIKDNGVSAMFGANGSGKCVSGETLINVKGIGEVQIKSLVSDPEEMAVYIPDKQLFVMTDDGYKEIEAFSKTEPQELYELKTFNGKTLIASKDHRVMTLRGWVKLKDLNEEDSIITE
jgi:intein/homing endonuclease